MLVFVSQLDEHVIESVVHFLLYPRYKTEERNISSDLIK